MALSNIRTALRALAPPLVGVVAPVGADLDFDPRDQARLTVWLPNKLAIPSGRSVAAWPDQSGWGNHAAQATAGAQPLNVAGALNTRQVRRFDGTDDNYVLPSFMWGDSASGGATRLAVFRPTNQNWASTTGAARWWNMSLGTTNQRFYSGSGTLYTANKLGQNIANGFVSGAADLNTAVFTAVMQQRMGVDSGVLRQWMSSLTTLDINAAWTGGGTPLNAIAGAIGGDVNGFAQMDTPEYYQYARELLQSERARHLLRWRRLYGIAIAA